MAEPLTRENWVPCATCGSDYDGIRCLSCGGTVGGISGASAKILPDVGECIVINRGQFVIELLAIWEEALRDKKIREEYPGAWEEIKTAIQVLEKTYSAEELEGRQ